MWSHYGWNAGGILWLPLAVAWLNTIIPLCWSDRNLQIAGEARRIHRCLGQGVFVALPVCIGCPWVLCAEAHQVYVWTSGLPGEFKETSCATSSRTSVLGPLVYSCKFLTLHPIAGFPCLRKNSCKRQYGAPYGTSCLPVGGKVFYCHDAEVPMFLLIQQLIRHIGVVIWSDVVSSFPGW